MCEVLLPYVKYFSHQCEIFVQSISLTHFFRSRVHQGETDLKSNLGQTEVLFHCCQVIKQETYQFLTKNPILKAKKKFDVSLTSDLIKKRMQITVSLISYLILKNNKRFNVSLISNGIEPEQFIFVNGFLYNLNLQNLLFQLPFTYTG